MKILLVGGGTLGSVNPLIAIYEQAKRQKKNWQWFWLGTKDGPERALIQPLGIQYEWLPSAKLRRYWSWQNLATPFLLAAAHLRSLLVIMAIRPDIIVSVGSFLAVPAVWAGFLLRKKIIIHQQDLRPGLANKLCAPFADKITVSFEPSLYRFPSRKTELIGNPARSWLSHGSREQAKKLWPLDSSVPAVLVMGGSSGAQALNQWVWQYLRQLTKAANVIHLAGLGKSRSSVTAPRYVQLEFLREDLAHALAAADLVIARAGISTLTELSVLRKAAILIPIPASHQEDNARFVARSGAAVIFDQNDLNERLVYKIFQLLSNPAERAELARNMGGMMKEWAGERMVEIIEEINVKFQSSNAK